MKLHLPCLCIFFVTLFFQDRLQATTFSDSANVKKTSPYRASNPKSTDLLHTKLEVKFDWEKSQMSGKASITAKPHFKPSSTLYLNARGMDIQSLEVFDLGKNVAKTVSATNPEILPSKKLPAVFKYENDSLKINLGREFKADEKYLVKINYVAKPNDLKKGGGDAITDDRGLYFINPKKTDKDKMPQIWTQGEIQANSAWFPTIDSPNEKMTSEILMTVESKYQTLSNGALNSSIKNADGTRTDHWKMDQPHSPYLVMMAVGEFKKVTDLPWNGKEISYYVEKEYEPYAKGIFGNTWQMIDFYSKVLGTPYPWAKYAQIVVRDYVSGAMENTSATLHGDQLLYQNDRELLDFKKGESVIAHELFHQWFGDLVTAESWSNLPLNESFATYGEYLWEEYKYGRDAADSHSQSSRAGYYEASKEKQVEVVRYHYSTAEDMFDAFSYNKGGQILHMLRKYVGDIAFFASLKLYLDQNRYKSAEIHHLRLAFEEITGEDLNWFFNQWFLSKGHPLLQIEKKYDENLKTLQLKVKQTQDLTNCPLYKLPVEIDIYAQGKKERRRITIDQEEQVFNFSVASAPDLVNFDAERQLLAKKTYTKSPAELLFQAANAPLYSDRYEATYLLMDKINEAEVFERFKTTAEKDPWWEIRQVALSALEKRAAEKEAELKPLVTTLAANDKNNFVRAAAIEFLARVYKGEELTLSYKKYVDEPSYAVASAALRALSRSDSNFAMQKAKTMESEKNETVFGAIAKVYSEHGSDLNNAYFLKSSTYFTGYGLYNFVKQYEPFLKRCVLPESFYAASVVLDTVYRKSQGFIRSTAKEAFKVALVDEARTRRDKFLAMGQSQAVQVAQYEKLLADLTLVYQKMDAN